MKNEQLTEEDIGTKTISELYHKVKLSKETLKEIQKVGDDKIDHFLDSQFKITEIKDNEEQSQLLLLEAYKNICDFYNKYCDLNQLYPSILACWVIGTYAHDYFPSYPFLFFNAMKGSGKSRTLKLTMDLAKNGQINNSMTEAVLFRTKGTLGIDEFEGIGRKGIENLRELLNSAYKKGIKVRRMKKVKTPEGEDHQVNEFNIYRPIALANIYGMEDVLGDRTIPIILEKSDKVSVINLIEAWDQESMFKGTKTILSTLFDQNNPSSVIKCYFLYLEHIHQDWNNYVISNNLRDTSSLTKNNTKQHILFKKIKEASFNGRELEITFPILIIANLIGENILDQIIDSLKEIIKGKREDQFIENRDITFIDFVAQSLQQGNYISIVKLCKEFKEFLAEDETEEKWITPKWIGRALKRLSLIKKSRRLSKGREVILDINKAQLKIKMFK